MEHTAVGTLLSESVPVCDVCVREVLQDVRFFFQMKHHDVVRGHRVHTITQLALATVRGSQDLEIRSGGQFSHLVKSEVL